MNKIPSGIVILEGGFGPEKEVSLRSGKHIRKSLESWNGLKCLDPEKQGIQKIIDMKPTVVINALHGSFGEDGQLQGFLDAYGISYTGESRLVSALCYHKIMTKHILRSNAILTPSFLWLKIVHASDKAALSMDAERAGIQFPVIMKPIEGGSSVGLQEIESIDMLYAKIKELEQPVESFFVEQKILGRELTIGVIHWEGQTIVLPIVEVIMKEEGLFSYQVKYEKIKSREYVLPALLDLRVQEYLERLCKKIDILFGFRECVRIDMLLGANDVPYVLEINTSPGMSEGSFVPLMMRAAKISLERFYFDRIKNLKIF